MYLQHSLMLKIWKIFQIFGFSNKKSELFFKRFFCVIRYFYDHIHVQKSIGGGVEILKWLNKKKIFGGRFDGYINFQMWGRFYGYTFKSKPTTLLN